MIVIFTCGFVNVTSARICFSRMSKNGNGRQKQQKDGKAKCNESSHIINQLSVECDTKFSTEDFGDYYLLTGRGGFSIIRYRTDVRLSRARKETEA